MVDGKQMTVIGHVEDLKVSYNRNGELKVNKIWRMAHVEIEIWGLQLQRA